MKMNIDKILDYLKPLYDYFRLTGEKTIKARMYVIYLLAYNTGMREGEIAGLTWDCLNVDKKEISVHQQVIRADGKYQIVSPKTEASYREVTISDKLISLLLELQENYRKLGYSTDFIFGSLFKKDTPTPPANIARFSNSVLKVLVLNDILPSMIYDTLMLPLYSKRTYQSILWLKE